MNVTYYFRSCARSRGTISTTTVIQNETGILKRIFIKRKRGSAYTANSVYQCKLKQQSICKPNHEHTGPDPELHSFTHI